MRPEVFPRVFGRYLLMERLSRGGMGEVYRAELGEIAGFQKPCVIKKILPDLAAIPGFVERFVAEARVAIRLQHANIAAVYEVGLVDGDYFLALEHVDGRDLGRVIQRARETRRGVPIPVALHVVREVAAGLAYAHRRSDDDGRPLEIVHCDVSPSNILLGFEGEVKVIDFGIARSRAAGGPDESFGFGKLGYMAPEQLGQGGAIDRRSDVYGAGVVLHELLTGSLPFEVARDKPVAALCEAIAAGAPSVSSRRPEIGTAFDDLVRRALSSDPAGRYPSADHFRDALQKKLVEVAPAFAADRLRVYVRSLFDDEIGDSSRPQPTDFRAYGKALDAARGGTVSFALARDWTSAIAAAEPSRARRRGFLAVGAATAGALLVGGLAIRNHFFPGTRPTAVSTAPESAAAPAPTGVPAPAPPAAPKPVPLSSPPPRASPPPRELHPPSRAKRASRPPRIAAPEVRAESAPPPLTRADVTRQHERLKRLYGAFEKQNGRRLDVEWQRLHEYYALHAGDLAGFSQRMTAFEKRLTEASASR